ncbi:hypothetical protein AAL_06794 [Moelleriella libera RCEF 2490]|uniref:Uncharacterized protein n=1 Tax=Moelleriella libera RCEF 2490 TaxID=1081109 RepID=A0A162IBB6_9HYPO|nr:hypothetical protein AAL_06794 [Moelleriella libera RCEF 2490]
MSPQHAESTKRQSRDTGFPEPFHSGPNTTLPHPEADLSPNATLSYEDVSAERILKRHRLSFLRKNKRTVSHGTIDPQAEAFNSIVSLSMFDVDAAQKSQQRTGDASSSSLRLSKDGVDSVHSGSKKYDDETPPTSPDVAEHGRGSEHHGRVSGVFKRWKRN